MQMSIGRKVITRRHNGVERVERVEQVSILATIALVPYTIGNQSQAMFILQSAGEDPKLWSIRKPVVLAKQINKESVSVI